MTTKTEISFQDTINLCTIDTCSITTNKNSLSEQEMAFGELIKGLFLDAVDKGPECIDGVIKNLETLMVDLVNLGIENQVDSYPLTHRFSDGVYLREIFIPAGELIIGKTHAHEHFNFITKGKAIILTKDGAAVLEGAQTLLSSAGTKRALYTLEDTVWTTIHHNPNNITDLVELEAFIIQPESGRIDATIEDATLKIKE